MSRPVQTLQAPEKSKRLKGTIQKALLCPVVTTRKPSESSPACMSPLKRLERVQAEEKIPISPPLLSFLREARAGRSRKNTALQP